MTKITVLTATYNWVCTLPTLYESLKKQSFQDYIWFVIDDGSDDGTEELIRRYMSEEIVSTKYY